MVIYGSGSIVSTLTRWGLIDEYLLFINPVVLGSGKPLFIGMQNKVELKVLGPGDKDVQMRDRAPSL